MLSDDFFSVSAGGCSTQSGWDLGLGYYSNEIFVNKYSRDIIYALLILQTLDMTSSIKITIAFFF